MNTKPNIYFAEQYFYPEDWSGAQLSRDIVNHLNQNGYNINVICSSVSYQNSSTIISGRPPSFKGIPIKRVNPIIFKPRNYFHRLFNDIYFSLSVLIYFLSSNKPSLFLIQTNPPFLILVTALAASLRNIPYKIIAMDLYPEVFNATFNNRWTKIIQPLTQIIFNASYSRAQTVYSLGPYMSKRLMIKGVKSTNIDIISNWSTGPIEDIDPEKNPFVQKYKLYGTFNIVYSGNIGNSHELESFLEAVEYVSLSLSNIKVLIFTNSTKADQIKVRVNNSKLHNIVYIMPLVQMEMLPKSLSLSTLGLVSLKQSFSGLVVPSKLFGYMSRGIPVLYIGPPSDISYYLEQAEAGFSFQNYNISKISEFLLYYARQPEKLVKYGQNGKNYYNKYLAKDVALQKYLNSI
ncbi:MULTISPECIES: glycosyltransferase family 4 protein [unclassified Prochlorococcus]|uniref:glycosyltransferase family 4 protein n=1 Tax=unclassified Prochlorococcus TaxID=2627481 RepID=UPI0005338F8B|nr:MULTISPECIES: glycosyltransferase family 4 protein [unclassified Prochlorococcus]KGG16325.1 putative colanic acid biosynthesis glycosyl transferase [Prochlorococcus sp. MIT 0603]KGG17941.1 putative colanic acid biosynthesis glycosyl transferase [Prochlorococcus sp. MIT 0602]